MKAPVLMVVHQRGSYPGKWRNNGVADDPGADTGIKQPAGLSGNAVAMRAKQFHPVQGRFVCRCNFGVQVFEPGTFFFLDGTADTP